MQQQTCSLSFRMTSYILIDEMKEWVHHNLRQAGRIAESASVLVEENRLDYAI
jgi:hypothetical protein